MIRFTLISNIQTIMFSFLIADEFQKWENKWTVLQDSSASRHLTIVRIIQILTSKRHLIDIMSIDPTSDWRRIDVHGINIMSFWQVYKHAGEFREIQTAGSWQLLYRADDVWQKWRSWVHYKGLHREHQLNPGKWSSQGSIFIPYLFNIENFIL